MLLGSGLIFVAHVVPLFILVILMGLETMVACIQAYVFAVLSYLSKRCVKLTLVILTNFMCFVFPCQSGENGKHVRFRF